MAPATPTGFHADTTETSIEWHWNAVDGAIGYVVQVSPDEMFDDNDPQIPTAETHHTVADLEPGTTLYGRVRAAGGTLEAPLLSPWTTHRTATSDVPTPEPEPAPDPVSVGFMIPDGEYPMKPVDGDDDKETAMATVNTDIMVMSNTSAVIMPMFVDDANGVSLASGENMPFAHVAWGALQADVVSDDGVTFMIQRTTMGANQEMEPTGDVAYVTCGPFECTESMMEVPSAPMIGIANSAACQAWEPTFDLEVGRVNNNSIDVDASGAVDLDEMSGIDLGWSYTSSRDFTATHDIATTSGKLDAKAKSSMTDLRVPNVGTGILGSMVPDGADADTDPDVVNACDEYTNLAGTVLKPGMAQCFRVKHDKDNDYLSNYSMTVAPKDAGVTWGDIAWDAFKGLTCESMTYDTSEVDVCEMFAADVANLGEVTAPVTVDGSSVISGWNLAFKANDAAKRNFTHLWYMQATKSSSSKDATHANTVDLYTARSTADTATDGIAANQVSKPTATAYWIPFLDDDGDPMYGDLGLTSTVGDDAISNTLPAWTDIKCTADDGGTKRSADDGDTDSDPESDGTLCDAEDVMIETSVTFVDGIGLGCSETVDFTLTCQWDADGGASVASDKTTRTTSPTFDTATASNYLSCKVSS